MSKEQTQVDAQSSSDRIVMHPIQYRKAYGSRMEDQSKINSAVTLAAYEVYCHLYGPQKAMVTDGCRGGFSVGELLAFLYARSFPKEEWRMRVDESIKNMEHVH